MCSERDKLLYTLNVYHNYIPGDSRDNPIYQRKESRGVTVGGRCSDGRVCSECAALLCFELSVLCLLPATQQLSSALGRDCGGGGACSQRQQCKDAGR
jgi:hypothetical protein